MSEQKKRIAILGAGSGGLTSIKACLEEGLEPICFEQSGQIAGLWRYRPEDEEGRSSVAKSTVINTSKETMAYSDFPPPADFPNFMHNRHMCKYFEMYAEHFGLTKHITFYHKVKWVTPSDDFEQTGRWKVTLARVDPISKEELEIKTEVYDGVMVCTGHHVKPFIPKYEGLDIFNGKKLHTHNFKIADEFHEKNVMVMGNGNSGADAAVELSMVTRQVYLSTRRGFWIRNRVGYKGIPSDLQFRTRANSYIPVSVQQYLLESKAKKVINYDDYGLTPSHRIFQQHPTLSDALPNRIICGTVMIKGPVKKFVPEGVIFQEEEGNVVPLDAIVFATGYEAGFPFVDPKVARMDNSACELFMFMIPPNLKHHTISFIGNIQPLGPIFPVAELQARLFALVVNGKVKLPPKSVMLKDIADRAEFNAKTYISGTRHVTEVLYDPFCDQLAKMIGVFPSGIKLLLTDPALFKTYFFGPYMTYQFRLTGPHSWPGAREAIMTYNDRVMTAFDTNTVARKRKALQPLQSSGIYSIKSWILLVGLMFMANYIFAFLH